MTTCGIAKCQLTKAKVCASMDGGKTELKYQNQCFLDAATCVNPLIKKVAACKARRVLSVAASNTTMTVDEVDSDLDDDIGSLVIPDGNFDDDDDDFLIIDDLMDPTTVVNDTVPVSKNTSAPNVSTPAPSKKPSAAHVDGTLAWAVLTIATVLVAAA
ncbi:hypothetical protein SDRG_14025 [Saprolegnia diclina VS20]|uniref:Kazal-like domain-containing protein n=1 Tax=Saprolegnia diclina (strain VS20) TaxID=1156394 RepID=T0Q0V7_SAPDV|nr:hypothetical protein SDRG_14025 [Saprolegnia diclina VS20]EQC28201.1 hypothetical protein SDRG_14025 [Saprolegnia diclina VS20]|eukprot:XP_008618350.1 hypothetical protein SDRG_14025 [Saprolegnia diclina VS20]